jgi:hypothetical protein
MRKIELIILAFLLLCSSVFAQVPTSLGKTTIQTYGTGKDQQYVFFHGVSELEIKCGGVWFVHQGKRKYISGNFWIETEQEN